MPHKNYTDSFNTYAVTKLPSFRDDFSSSVGWTTTNSSALNVDTGGGTIDFNTEFGFTEVLYYDLGIGSVSNTKWEFRFKLDIDTFTAGSPNIQALSILLSDNTSNYLGTQDSFGFNIRVDSAGSKYQAMYANNSFWNVNVQDFTVATVSAGIIYVKIRRISSISASISIYSDATYTTLVETQVVTIPSGIGGLRYIKLMNLSEVGGSANDLIGTIDNMEFFNEAQKGTTTFQNDFSTTVGWTTESSATYDISAGILNFSTPTGLVNTTAGTYDLGASLSDTQWVIRFKLDITNKIFTGDQSVIYIGMSDISGAGTANNQDGIFLNLNVLTSLIHDIRIKDVNGARPDSTPADATFSHGLVVETLYGELKRTSATTYEGSLYSDSSYTVLIERKTGTCASTVIGLRYFQLEVDTRTLTTGNLAGTIDNLEIYDGVVVTKNILKPIPERDFNFFNSTGWVQTGTGVSINTTTQRIEGWANDGSDRRVTFDMGTNGILSEQDWTIEFEYEFSASTSVGHGICTLSDLNQDIDATSNNDALVVLHGTTTNQLRLLYVDNGDVGGGAGILSPAIPIVINTRYYVRVERIKNTTFKLSVFLDPDFTTHISSSPVFGIVASTVDGFRYLHSQNLSGGSTLRTLTGFLDNLKVYRTQRGTEKENKWLVIG